MAPKKQLDKKKSIVTATDSSGQVYKSYYVWVSVDPPEEDGTKFKKALVMPGSTQDVFKCKFDTDETVHEFKQEVVYNLNQNLDVFGFHDIGTLPHTNVPCVLDFLRERLARKQIYSTADPLLVALNPFTDVGVCGDKNIIEYRDAMDTSKLPPHVFVLARTALENLHSVKKSQTIVVSGESGAGKTEATKHVMRYFAAAKSGTMDLRVQSAILAANPILEAFGNAKTIRNNNSSRFGRFMQMKVAATGGIQAGVVRNFLLEKSRILTQDGAERSYHIFYQLIKGASPELKSQLHLKGLTDYKSLNPLCPDAPGIDDLAEWADVEKAILSIGMNEEERLAVLSVVSGVLLMGNVQMTGAELDGVPEAAQLCETTRSEFETACKLMFLDPALTETGLTIKISIAGGKEIRGRPRKEEGQIFKESLIKAMYDKLFDWIVLKLNTNIEPPSWQEFLGMLDIFGFEVFVNNSLEQLFINITNEMLQKNFTDVVFQKETTLYSSEGISAASITWTTNDEVIQALVGKGKSLMAALDDQCLAPGGSDEKFLAGAYNMLKDSTKLIKPKVAGNVNFRINHTIGDIPYNVEGFLFKNKDILRPDLVEVTKASESSVVRAMFEKVTAERGKMKGQYIGAQFLAQLESLMGLINSTEPHFVRCVKPNEQKKPLLFDQSKTLVQLYSLSILEALELRKLGYSYRRPFEDFLFQFKFIDLSLTQDPDIDKRDAAQKLMKQAGVTDGWQLGKTMLFMKQETAKLMVKKQRDCMSIWGPSTSLIEAYYLKQIYKRKAKKAEAAMIRLQAQCRRKLVNVVKAPSHTVGRAW